MDRQRLPIPMGRDRRTVREQRFCNKCSSLILGDRYYITLEYNNEDSAAPRCQYISLYQSNMDLNS